MTANGSSESTYLTRERLVELEKDLHDLKTNGRKSVAQKIAEARGHGDLSENAEYDAAKEEQQHLELRIAKLEQTLSRSGKRSPKRQDIYSLPRQTQRSENQGRV